MSTEQPWGAQPPAEPRPAPRWSGRKTAAAVGIAVAIAAGGGAAIWAATNNDSGNTPGGPRGPGGPGSGPGVGPPGLGRGDGLGLVAGALHGEFVIADGSTDLLQTGKVTAISATSIDLTSTDAFAKKYTINSATVIDNGRRQPSDIKTGDEVTVIAKKTDASALSLLDRSALPQAGPGRR